MTVEAHHAMEQQKRSLLGLLNGNWHKEQFGFHRMFDKHIPSSDVSKIENGLWPEYHQYSDIVGASWVPPQPPMRIKPLLIESPDAHSFCLFLFTFVVPGVTITVVGVPG